MKRMLLPAALVVALFTPQVSSACGGMAALLRRMLIMEGISPSTFLQWPTPGTAAPSNTPAPSSSPSSSSPAPTQAAPTPQVVYTPPPPPPPPMVQLSPQDIGGSLRLRSTLVESENEQVTQDLQEGLIIS